MKKYIVKAAQNVFVLGRTDEGDYICTDTPNVNPAAISGFIAPKADFEDKYEVDVQAVIGSISSGSTVAPGSINSNPVATANSNNTHPIIAVDASGNALPVKA